MTHRTNTALDDSHLAIVRLLARQAVQSHLTRQSQGQRGNQADRPNRPVQSKPTTK